jgi:hypothetical protein
MPKSTATVTIAILGVAGSVASIIAIFLSSGGSTASTSGTQAPAVQGSENVTINYATTPQVLEAPQRPLSFEKIGIVKRSSWRDFTSELSSLRAEAKRDEEEGEFMQLLRFTKRSFLDASDYYFCSDFEELTPPALDLTVFNPNNSNCLLIGCKIRFLRLAHKGGTAGDFDVLFVRPGDEMQVKPPDFISRTDPKTGADGDETWQITEADCVMHSFVDSILMPPKTPYRFSIFLQDYFGRVPDHALLQIVAVYAGGETQSEPIFIRNPSLGFAGQRKSTSK